MVEEHEGWELVGIYADEGISGTSLQHRVQFNKLIADCEAALMDKAQELIDRRKAV